MVFKFMNRELKLTGRLYLTFIFIMLILSSACKKISSNDPALSFRSRQSRLIGKWKITRTYYYENKLSGPKNDGDTFIYYQEFLKNNTINTLNPLGEIISTYGNWYWMSGNDNYKDYTAIGIGHTGIPVVELHNLIKLSYKNIESIEKLDAKDKGHFYKHYWTRM